MGLREIFEEVTLDESPKTVRNIKIQPVIRPFREGTDGGPATPARLGFDPIKAEMAWLNSSDGSRTHTELNIDSIKSHALHFRIHGLEGYQQCAEALSSSASALVEVRLGLSLAVLEHSYDLAAQEDIPDSQVLTISQLSALSMSCPSAWFQLRSGLLTISKDENPNTIHQAVER